MSDIEAAPSVTIPAAPLPPGGRFVWLRGAGGARIRAARFDAASAKGIVVLSGGRTEFIEKYAEVIAELLGRGFSVLTHDWRGQGLSARLLPDPLKGHADGFEDFVTDLGVVLKWGLEDAPERRLAIAHSMGGCLTLLALADGVLEVEAAVLSAPMLGLSIQGSAALRALISVAMTLGLGGLYTIRGPGEPFADQFEADALTHDRDRYRRTLDLLLARRELALGGVTWGWLASALRALDRIHAPGFAGSVRTPLTVVAAGDDRLVDNARIRSLCDRLAAARYVEVGSAFHELMMEADPYRAQFWEAFDAVALSPGA